MRRYEHILGLVAGCALLGACDAKPGAASSTAAASGAAPAGAATAAGVAAAPMKSDAAEPTFPRLTSFPDAIVMTKVNALLAEQEKTDRGAKADCQSQAKEQKTGGAYQETTEVTYLSPRFLTVNVVTSYECGGAYPTDGAEAPMTFELGTGTTVDWSKAFKPGFLAAADADEKAPPSPLTKLYRTRYPKTADAECKKLIGDSDPMGSPIFWLDKKRGLVVQPDFPHVTAACAEQVALGAADVAPWIADAAAVADLKANLPAK